MPAATKYDNVTLKSQSSKLQGADGEASIGTPRSGWGVGWRPSWRKKRAPVNGSSASDGAALQPQREP
jgi:hypothetical protein